MSDKISPDQLRDEMLETFRSVARYWANVPDFDAATGTETTIADRCDGVVFSILSQLDGCGSLPAFDLTAHVHPDDEDQTCEGVTVSDMLHEHYHRRPIPPETGDPA